MTALIPPPFDEVDRFGGASDAVYALLVEAHEGLSDAQSEALNTRLVLLLAHAVGDLGPIEEAVRFARESVRADPRRCTHALERHRGRLAGIQSSDEGDQA